MDKKSQMMDKIADLSPAQRALLEKRLKGKGLGAVNNQLAQRGIPKRTIDGPMPLSNAQQRLWVIEQFESGNYTYNIPVSVRMKGSVDLVILERCINEVIKRHETMRTSFATVNEEPVQVIAPEVSLTLEVIDLQAQFAALAEREAAANRMAREIAQVPFDLTQAPLMRAKMLQLDASDYVLVLVMHHIVSDGWSLGVVIQEIVAMYTAFYHGQPSPLPELPVQFGDYTMWQRESQQGDALDKQLEYWKQQLSGTLPILHVPTDAPRPMMQTYHGAKYNALIPDRLVKAVNDLSQQEGATAFMTLMALFKVLLYRYTGQEDLIVGTPIAGRSRREIEPLIGMFVNTLAFRTDLSGNLTFRDLLARVKKVSVDAFANQDVPFEKLVDELQPERNPSHPLLVQVLFILQNAPLGTLELPGMTLESENIDNKTSKFDLTLGLIEKPNGLMGEWEYNTDLFSEATIARMMEHYVVLLEEVVQNPDRPIAQLPMLTSEERTQLAAWNDTARAYPGDEVTIQQLFEAQVERTPERVAVHFEGQELTYAELNRRANQLANRLQQWGVGPETMVGICLDRSLEMLVGMLGIMKAGGAYVPIDPGYPAERIAYVLEDANTPVVLTQQHLQEKVTTGQAKVLCLDSEWDRVADADDANVESGATADNLAYMIYTSGSTGKPKGVMIPHRGVCNRLLWMLETYPLAADDRILQKTPFSFDISIWEFFWPLLSGARLVIAKPGGHQETDYLVKVISEQRITNVHFVPSMLQLFLEEANVESCTSLRMVLAGGEAVTYELQERLFARFAHVKFLDLYGPTECSIECTSWLCRRDDERKIVPIGHPIANTQTYILDKQLQPMPIGLPGELHIGGYGLARGYHK
ncbi:MAG: non-ribosomal peptide synthetase, partial [Tumebacillaceae bacterium]